MSCQNQQIEMISVCGSDGSLKPLRFRFEDEEHRLQVVQITEVISCKEICYVGIEAFVYVCRAEFGGREHLFEVKYTVRTHKWVLFRMLY